ncbi:MAG TPA: hypothetical protein VM099_05445 [Gemmatimonadaceae bacterium]|nr:hypothetical protein [Gemmatimonadaceae bacterium]
MFHVRSTAVAALLSTASLMACSPKEQPNTTDSSAAPVTTAAQTAPTTVHLVAKDYSFDAPAQISAGLATLHLMNQGKELHHAQLIKLTEGKTFEDFMTALKAMKPNTPPPSWVVFAGGPNAAAPGGTAETTQLLEAGNYALICFIPSADGVPHAMKGMVRGLVVTASNAAPAAEPTPTATMTLADYNFTMSTPLKSGQNVIRVENGADQPHEVVLVKLGPGKTMKDFQAWLPVSNKGAPPPGMPMGGVVGLSKGQHATFNANLDAGDYVLVCFLEDAKDGKPHFLHGMVQEFKIQ